MFDLRALDEVDVRYTRLNSQRSLRPVDGALEVVKLGPLTVLLDRARPHDDYYNRVVGLDASGLAHLDLALARLNGVDARVDLHVDHLTRELGDALIARGFAPRTALVWLVARPLDVARSGVPVRRLIAGEADELFSVFARTDAMDGLTPEVVARRRRWYCTPEFRCYVAEIDGEPAGWATMFVDREARAAILGNAFVLEPFRRRGGHAALFAARAQDAASLSLDAVYTDVEPSTASLRNAIRSGFVRLTSTIAWMRRA